MIWSVCFTKLTGISAYFKRYWINCLSFSKLVTSIQEKNIPRFSAIFNSEKINQKVYSDIEKREPCLFLYNIQQIIFHGFALFTSKNEDKMIKELCGELTDVAEWLFLDSFSIRMQPQISNFNVKEIFYSAYRALKSKRFIFRILRGVQR